MPANEESTGAVTVGGQRLTLFVEPPAAFESMLADIRQARRRVWLEVYIFADDEVGHAFAEALKERARAGLDVRVLYDAFGSMSAYSSFFLKMQAAGIRVASYNSLGAVFHRLAVLALLNRRDHRKLLIVDDEVAYFGGMNIVANAQPGHSERVAIVSSSHGWRDVHARLQGNQQAEIAESFERSWYRAHREKVGNRPAAYRKGHLNKRQDRIQFFDSGPGRKYTRSGRIFTHLFNLARHEITLSMAYFLPVGQVWRALLRARQRGVRIRVVLPAQSDVQIVQRATNFLYGRLLRLGIEIHERQGAMLHSKVMVVDGDWTVLGSSNLDARSLWINLEFLAVARSSSLAELVHRIIGNELALSRPITLREVESRSWWDRLQDRLAWTLRWWL
jgi:cardiolipin synthase